MILPLIMFICALIGVFLLGFAEGYENYSFAAIGLVLVLTVIVVDSWQLSSETVDGLSVVIGIVLGVPGGVLDFGAGVYVGIKLRRW